MECPGRRKLQQNKIAFEIALKERILNDLKLAITE
jgi:hypothetical protein